jgi:alkanesulfonate monooxygenase SsuD/methylene tetrahydromethanopterin reductase-like flavin-dependent oxidoreductase (luciferase family)
MTEVAAEVCDGLMQHPFTTERYLRERTLLALQRGFARGGPAADGFSVALSGLVVCGRTAQDMARSAAAVRQQIAFYGSTPSYRSSELSWLSRTGADDRWRRMGELIDDEVLGAFAVVAEPGQLAAAVRTRFAGVIDRFTFYAPYDHDPGLFDQAIAGLRPERAGPP